MTDELRQRAFDFLDEVVNVAKDQGYQAAKAEFDEQVNRLRTDYEAKVNSAYQEGYNKHKAEVEASQEVSPPTPEPVVPEPQPTDDPVNEGYSREKVVEELLAIKGSKSYALGIVDVNGNVYANENEWVLDGKPQVLGIGYTDGTLHLCMLPKTAGTAKFGFDGVKVAGVYHTKLQWKKDSKPNQPAAYEDYSGTKNSDALVKAMESYDAAEMQGTAISKARSIVAANGKRGYLPPCGEMRIYCLHHKQVDVLLKAVGGDKIRNRTGNAGEGIWTSTGLTETQGWIVLYSDSNTQPAQRNKTTTHGVRAFVEL